MLRFIAFGDLIANQEVFKKVIDLDLTSYDLAIFTGDIPNPDVFKKLSKQMVEEGLGDLGDKQNIAKETEPKEALRQIESEIRAMKNLFAEMNKKIRIIGVWGNADNVKILNKVPIERHIKIVHKKIFLIREDIYIIGYNGRPLYIFEKENKEQWAFAEEDIYMDLDRLFREVEGYKVILVTHDPPYGILDRVVQEYRQYAVGTYGERAKYGHIGSIGLRKIVNKYKPILHVFGHIHECKGVFSGETIFINIGSTGEDREVAEVLNKPEGTAVVFRKI